MFQGHVQHRQNRAVFATEFEAARQEIQNLAITHAQMAIRGSDIQMRAVEAAAQQITGAAHLPLDGPSRWHEGLEVGQFEILKAERKAHGPLRSLHDLEARAACVADPACWLESDAITVGGKLRGLLQGPCGELCWRNFSLADFAL